MSISSSLYTATSGIRIVDQAPKQTVIMTTPIIYIIPPHRDAFKRTAYSIYYICTRILWNILVPAALHHQHLGWLTAASLLHWVYGCSAVIYATIYFLPQFHNIDYKNGNTYIFMIPMGCGLFVDAVFQLPLLQCHPHSYYTTNNNNNNTEGVVVCWNINIITQLDLLLVLLSGLVVAFAFTLAFRTVLPIKHCYWYSALIVHGIVGYLITKAIPYIALFLE
jgi:hypothetical protein